MDPNSTSVSTQKAAPGAAVRRAAAGSRLCSGSTSLAFVCSAVPSS